MNALYRGLTVSGVLAVAVFYPITMWLLGDGVMIEGKLVSSMNIYPYFTHWFGADRRIGGDY